MAVEKAPDGSTLDPFKRKMSLAKRIKTLYLELHSAWVWRNGDPYQDEED